PTLPDLHDPAPSGGHHDGAAAARGPRSRAGRSDLPVLFRRERRPDDRNQSHETDARSPQRAGERSVKARLTFAMALVLVGYASPQTTSRAAATSPSRPDPRIGLKAGWFNAGEAAWNMRLVSTTPPSPDFINRDSAGDFRFINSDLTFRGTYV